MMIIWQNDGPTGLSLIQLVMPEGQEAVNRVQQLLHRVFRVTLVDGRVFTGELQALDKQGNLVLAKTVEHMSQGQRVVGMALVPQAVRKSVELQVTLEERLDMLKLVQLG